VELDPADAVEQKGRGRGEGRVRWVVGGGRKGRGFRRKRTGTLAAADHGARERTDSVGSTRCTNGG
jgi:hypothetical protein